MKTPLTPTEITQTRNLPPSLEDLAADPGSVLYSLSFTQLGLAGSPLTARATANIAEWSTYLPKDCVEAMIRDGWHLTV